jgi:hypothetical protein
MELARPADEETRAVQFVGHRHEAPNQLRRHARPEITDLVVFAQHPERRHQQRRAEHVEHPVESRQQLGAGHDHHAAQHDRPDDSPEQHAILVEDRDLQVREHQRHHEDVVYRQRPLEQVPGDVLHDGIPAVQGVGGRLEPVPAVLVQAVDHERVGQSDADPDSRPEQRLAHGQLGSLAVQYAQVQEQEPEEQREEADPDERNQRTVPPGTQLPEPRGRIKACRRSRPFRVAPASGRARSA